MWKGVLWRKKWSRAPSVITYHLIETQGVRIAHRDAGWRHLLDREP